MVIWMAGSAITWKMSEAASWTLCRNLNFLSLDSSPKVSLCRYSMNGGGGPVREGHCTFCVRACDLASEGMNLIFLLASVYRWMDGWLVNTDGSL